MADAKSKKEIERKFLVSMIQAQSILTGELSKQIKYLHIEQGYLRSGKRLRRQSTSNSAEQEYFSVTKLGSGLERVEYDEKKISEYEFLQFWPDTMCSRLEKERALIPHGDLKIELDRYLGDLSGLMVAEVEFDSVEAARTFVAPDWFGLEVTDRQEYSNHSLATSGLPKTELELGINLAINAIRNKFSSGSDLVIVAVAGGSASGKGYITKVLKDYFGEDASALIMDNYFKGGKAMEREGIDSWDDPRAVNIELCAQHLQNLKNGNDIKCPLYSFEAGESSWTFPIASNRIIILDGLYALDDRFAADFKIFVDSDLHSRFLRRLQRDLNRTRQTGSEIAEYFLNYVQAAHETHIQPSSAKADLVISNNLRVSELNLSKTLKSQLKFAITDRQAMSKSLLSLGFTHVDSVSQLDVYYHLRSNQVNHNNLVRVRRETREGQSSSNFSLSCEGVVIGYDLFRTRPLFQVDNCPLYLEDRLKEHYDGILTVRKLRDYYQLHDLVFVIDDLINYPKGPYLEVQSNELNQSLALYLIENLLSLGPAINQSYFEILMSRSDQ